MTTLEARNYIATTTDIEQLAKGHMDALAGSAMIRTTYLRALVATAQSELQLKPGKARKVDPETVKTQLATVDKIHDRFYVAVLHGIEAGLSSVDPETGSKYRDRKQLLHRRANFARSAKSTLRGWLKTGHDLGTLVPRKVTKYALARELPRGTAEPSTVGRTVDRWVGRLRKLLHEAAETDKEGVVHALEQAMTSLAQELLGFGVAPTRSAATAARERRPFRTDKGVFWPTVSVESAPTA